MRIKQLKLPECMKMGIVWRQGGVTNPDRGGVQ